MKIGSFSMDRRAFAASLLALAACDNDSDGIKEPPPPTKPPETQAAIKVTPVTDGASLKALLEDQATALKLPALAAYVFDRQDMLIAAATGVRVAGQPAAATIDDPWHLGSCTKAMTAALYARLVEAGKAKWGATLPELLPDLAPQMDAAWTATTIEQLLSHSSGLGDVSAPWLVARRMDSRPYTDQRTETASETLSKPPAGKPGEFAYSNLGYIIAGAAIERITGESWEKALIEHVFNPLGMKKVGFGPPAGDAPQGHRNVFGRFEPMGVAAAADNPLALGPAGTVHATFEEWAKFARVFFDPTQTFLKAESVQKLLTPVSGVYALGWGVADSAVGGRVYTHTGSNTLWWACVTIQPDAGKAFFVASNAAPADDGMAPVMRSLMAAVMGGTIL